MENYGKYQLLSKLATGGMAQVFLARQTDADGERLIVLKRILPHLAENEEFVRMFLQEARVAARLHHTGIAQIFDLGKVGDSFFIAMEYVHGEDFRRIVRQAATEGRTLPVPIACRMVIGAARGLDHAHEALDEQGRPLNIVHRDVSPQNLLVTFDGQTKVIDFGIAKAADSANNTRTGVLKGKYSYMSPEQADGKRVDRRSDVFALGVVLWELITQQRLFRRATDLATIQAVLACKVPPPSSINPSIDPELDALVLRVLSKDRDERTPTAGHLAAELEAFLEKHELPGTTKHLRQFMRELYADRLSREAQLGHPEYVELAVASVQARQTPSGSSFEFGRPPKAPPVEDAAAEDVNLDPTAGRPPKIPTTTDTDRLSNPQDVVVRATDGVRLAPQPRRATPLSGPPPLSPSLAQGELSEVSRVVRGVGKRRAFYTALGVTLAVLVAGGAWAWLQRAPRSGQAGSVRIKSDPPGASLSVDGQPREERTPATIVVDPTKPHVVRVTLDGYAPAEEPLEPFEGTAVRDVKLRRSQVGALRIDTNPPGAAIVLDGARLAQVTPAILTDLEPGREHEVVLSLAGFLDEVVAVDVAAGKTKPLSRTLRRPDGPRPAPTPTPGPTPTPTPTPAPTPTPTPDPEPTGATTLQVTTTPAGIALELDGADVGASPLRAQAVRPGRHDVRFLDPSRFLDQTQVVNVAAGEAARVERVFNPRKVRLNVTPFAKVYIKDREFADSPSDAELVPGTYRLTFSCPDIRAKRTETVTIPPGADAFKIQFALKEGEGYDPAP